MCFSKEMSASFAALGLFISLWVYFKSHNTQLAIGVFYFFLMEFLQYFQYLVIDDCDNEWNKILTILGFAHICFQPYFTHIMNSSLSKSRTVLTMYVPILRLCLVGGVMLFLRYVFSDSRTLNHAEDGPNGVSTEWLRGEKLCTFSGKYHLAWSVPMSDVSYYTPSAAIHSFLMFVPFFVLKPGMVFQGLVLWLSGPFLAAYITPNLFEQASIWCFFSIAQIAVMLFVIRSVLLSNGEKAKEKRAVPYLDLRFIWPMGVVDPSAAKDKAKAN